MAKTVEARAKLGNYVTMLVGSLIIVVAIAAMTTWSGVQKTLTFLSVAFLVLWIAAHSLNRRAGRHGLY